MFIKKLKAKILNTKRRNRLIASVVSCVFMFVLIGPVIADAATIRVDNKHNEDTMRYLEFSNGKAIFFPTKIISGTNTEVYCLQHQKLTPQGELYTTDDGAGEIDGGVRYILAQNPNTGNKDKDYYIKQLALQYYLGQVPEVRKTVDSPVKRAILQIANDAKEHSDDPLVPNLTLSPSNPELKYYPEKNTYETDWIDVKTVGDIDNLYTKLKAPEGMQIVLPGGKVVSNLGKNDTRFFLRIPAKDVKSDFTMQMGVRADFNVTEVTSFVPRNTDYQKIAYPKETVVKGNKDSYLTANLKMVPGQVQVVKTNENGDVLAGAKFKLMQNDKVIATGTTDESGKVTFPNVPRGDYQVIEDQAPTGYLVSDQKQNVSVTDSKTSTVKFVDKIIKGKIRVTKEDSKTGEKLAGAEFQVTNKATNKVVQTITTGQDGTATTGDLPYGEYIIKETKAPDKYTLNGKEYVASISENGKIVDLNVGNNIITGKIQVTKEDSETGAKLAGAEFQVINKATNKVVQTLTTGQDGTATTGDLPYGQYIIKETKAPAKYTLNGEQHVATIDKNGVVVKITHKDTIFKGKIKITKEDAETGAKLAGAEFQVVNKATNKVVQTITTGQDGTATTGDLPYGQYIIKETKAPAKYTLNGEQHAATIDKNGALVEVTHKDTIMKSSVQVTKEDAETGSKLAGAEFQVIDKATNKVVQTITTDKNGLATANNLPFGEYLIKETKAPAGYTLNSETHNINVNKDGEVVKITHKDRIIKSKVQVTKEDTETGAKLAGAKFQVIDKATDKVVQTIVTDKNGIATTNDLPFGQYIVKEVQSPDKYTLNNVTHDVNVSKDGEVIKITHQDRIIKSKIQVTKEDAETGAKLAGAEFQVIDKATNKVVQTITTESNGIATTNDLPFGEYLIKEIKAPKGYTLNGETHDVNVNKDGEVIKLTHKDRIIKSSIEVSKVDMETGAKLEGAKFQIIDKASGQAIKTITTDKNGIARANDLPFGQYAVKEVQSPDKYTLNGETHDINVNKDGEVIKVTHKDRIIKGKIQVSKTDAETGAKLEGAEFQVINKATNKVVQTITTDKHGIATTDNLNYGEYIIKETKAPAKYTLNGEEHFASITQDGQLINVNHSNRIIKGKVSIKKFDKEIKNMNLAGAEFTIFDSNNKAVEKLTTNNDGFAISKDLNYGNYTMKETKAPKGYLLNNNVWKISITEDAKTYNFDIADQIIKGKIQVLKLDAFNAAKVEGATFGVYAKNVSGVNSDKLVETITTDKNGLAITGDLRYGEYYLKELKAPANYILSDITYPVSVTENAKIYTENIKNTPVQARIKVLKIDGENKQPIANTEFKIVNLDTKKDVSFSEINGDKVISKTILKTNENGEILTPQPLRCGNYSLVEVQSAEGYVLGAPINFTISKETNMKNIELVGPTFEMSVTNERITGSMQLTKLDSVTGNALSDATFKITCTKGFKKGETYNVTTDKSGIANISKLEYGDYRVDEIKAPTGYVLNKTPLNFQIRENGQKVILTMKDTPIYNDIDFAKTDVSTGKVIDGASIKITCTEGLDKGKVIEFISSHNGNRFHLKYGKYKFEETKAPTGYNKTNEVGTFEITEDGITQKANLNNTPITGIVDFTKTDVTNDKVIPGAKIKITCTEGLDKGKVIEFTSKDVADHFNLKFGKYTFEETQAPTGYQKNTDIGQFEITEQGQVVKANIKDKHITGSIDFTKTDVTTGKHLDGAKVRITCVEGFNKGKAIEFTTSSKGNSFTLDYGKYTYQEIQAPEGYNLNDAVGTFEITQQGQVLKADIKDTPITSEVDMTKTDITNAKEIPGARIKITCTEGLDKGKVIEFTSKDTATKMSLKYGKYEYQETIAPKGYNLNTEVGKFEVTKQGEVIKANIKDTPITSEIDITKTDVTTSKEIPGAKIKITCTEGLDKGKVIEFTSKDTATKMSLKYGKYEYQETVAPEGYNLNTKVGKFEVTKQGEVIKCNIKDTPITSNVEITKTDVTTGKEIPGAKIKITCIEGLDKGKVIEFTSKNTATKFNLKYGKYEYQETAAPKGYNLNTEKQTFEVTKQGEVIKCNVKDTPITGKLIIDKQDIATSKEVPGAKIKITCLEGLDKGKVIEFTSKDTASEFILKAGKYEYQEIQAPNGYEINKEVGQFEITEQGQIVKCTVKDKRIPEKLAQTGGVNQNLILGLGALLVALGCIIEFLRRKVKA